jgi:hypothetical protein
MHGTSNLMLLCIPLQQGEVPTSIALITTPSLGLGVRVRVRVRLGRSNPIIAITI